MEKIRFNSISKFFPGVVALDGVSFGIASGECHAVVGENGAGKSTLGKILAGIYTPDEGTIEIDGKVEIFDTPAVARKKGVCMVHQELISCPNLSVAENIFLGNLPCKAGFIDTIKLKTRAVEVLSELECADIDICAGLSELSIAQIQMVQIASAIAGGSKIIIMDEPTSSISKRETDILFKVIEKLKSKDVTIIYISHRMEEIFLISDRISVLRDGKYIGTVKKKDTSKEEIIKMMVGRSIELYNTSVKGFKKGDEILRIENLSIPGKLHNINFSVPRGEILGFAGLVGAGRSEIARAIFGLEEGVTGDVYIKGKKVKIKSSQDAISLGIGLIPEDRKLQGLVLNMTAGENLTLITLPFLSKAGFIIKKKEEYYIKDYYNKLSIKPFDYSVKVALLSGGNQQKVILARWLARNCDILIIDEPTRGIDVKAKTEIHSLIYSLALEGKAIIVISSELVELLNITTRIIVMKDGRISGEFETKETNEEELIKLMTGVKADETRFK